MLNKLQKRKDSGFTIIEVLIVLAIAGLILLVVFLAVPALQRNSRNTQRKNDVSALAGAVNEFVSNNGGAAVATADVSAGGAAVANAKLGFYSSSNVYGHPSGAGIAAVTAGGGAGSATKLTVDNIQVYVGDDCSAGANAAPVAGSSRSVAIEYAVETGGAPQIVCSQS